MILAAAAALVLSAACTKSEITSSMNDEPQAIGFTNYVPRSLNTKAGSSFIDNTATANLPAGSQFVVYGYAENNAQTWQTTTAPSFMNGITVTFDATSNTPTVNYSPVRYWPSGDTPNWLSFYGYYPAGGAGIAPTVTAGMGTIKFTARDAAADMVDFMVTDLAKDYIYGTAAGTSPNIAVNGVVPLTFHHMLTKVKFVFQTSNSDANTTITINSATLKNVKKEATLTPGQTFAAHSWGTPSEMGNYAVTINGTATNVNLTNASDDSDADLLTSTSYNPMTVDDADIFLMVPQPMVAKGVAPAEPKSTNPQYLEIVWTITPTTGAAIQNTSTIYLNDIDIKVGSDTENLWVANKSVVYTITVGLHPIKFTGSVEAWDADTNGAINVN